MPHALGAQQAAHATALSCHGLPLTLVAIDQHQLLTDLGPRAWTGGVLILDANHAVPQNVSKACSFLGSE